jgi:hypothetical protein
MMKDIEDPMIDNLRRGGMVDISFSDGKGASESEREAQLEVQLRRLMSQPEGERLS